MQEEIEDWLYMSILRPYTTTHLKLKPERKIIKWKYNGCIVKAEVLHRDRRRRLIHLRFLEKTPIIATDKANKKMNMDPQPFSCRLCKFLVLSKLERKSIDETALHKLHTYHQTGFCTGCIFTHLLEDALTERPSRWRQRLADFFLSKINRRISWNINQE